jgi:hypothetical protein
MQPILPPIRRDDLIYGQAALIRRLEEFRARDRRLDLQNIEPFPWGFLLRPSASERFRAWWATQYICQHLWLDVAELDPLGSLFLFSRDPFGACAALCSWQDFALASSHIRLNCIGPTLWDRHKLSLLAHLLEELAQKFGLEQRPLNSCELPSYATTEWGTLIQVQPDQVPHLLDYLCLEPPVDSTLPILVKLGGNLSSVLAFGLESVRIGLCWNGCEDPVILDLQDWLGSVHKSHRNSLRKETSQP